MTYLIGVQASRRLQASGVVYFYPQRMGFGIRKPRSALRLESLALSKRFKANA